MVHIHFKCDNLISTSKICFYLFCKNVFLRSFDFYLKYFDSQTDKVYGIIVLLTTIKLLMTNIIIHEKKEFAQAVQKPVVIKPIKDSIMNKHI